MTGKVVSLSRARKSRARDDAKRQADANAAKHGRKKVNRLSEATRKAKADQDLDDHKRDD